MRHSLALLTLLVLVPSRALADDDNAAPAAPAGPVAPSPTPTVEAAQPLASSPARPVAQPTPAPSARPPATEDEEPSSGGYVAPHFVPYLGGDIPRYAHIETKPNMSLVGGGAAILGTSYFVSVIYALATCGAQMDCRAGSGWLYLPVVGPFITAAQSQTTGGAALAAFDGGVQMLGAALAVAGLVAPKKFVVWQDKAASISVTPMAAGAGMAGGVAVTLTHL